VTGTVDVVADGYGTLILPYASFDDVIRVKTTQTYIYLINGTELFPTVVESFAWYSSDLLYPLLRITSEQV
ncbi:MAG: hypothetical protein ACPGXL_08560, partial [Chitinophagales bacterium]